MKTTAQEATLSTIAHLYMLESLSFQRMEMCSVQELFHSMKPNSGQGMEFWEGGEMHLPTVREELTEIVEAWLEEDEWNKCASLCDTINITDIDWIWNIGLSGIFICLESNVLFF